MAEKDVSIELEINMKSAGKIILHSLLLWVEIVVLVSICFLVVISGLKLHDRVYTSIQRTVKFSIAPGQEDLLRDLQYFRVDYTTHSRPVADDDSDFIAGQMIHVPRNLKDPYAEYEVELPADVLKVRVNTHYKKGKEHRTPIKMKSIVFGDEKLDESVLKLYHNHAWNFYGQCYTPNPFMRGYYIEYWIIVGVITLILFVLSFLYFMKSINENRGMGV